MDKIEIPSHDYIKYVVVYVAGYLLRTMQKWKKTCKICMNSIITKPEEHDNSLYTVINLLNRGVFMYPSLKVINLLNCIEQEIRKVTQCNKINKDTFEL